MPAMTEPGEDVVERQVRAYNERDVDWPDGNLLSEGTTTWNCTGVPYA